MKREINGELLNVPEHVAVIMDGNGRWAKKRLLPRNMGHRQGAKVLEQICRDAADLGIRYLTVYAFSTENWKRSTEEVTGIMNLLRSYLSNCVERASKDGLRIRVIGDRSALDADIVDIPPEDYGIWFVDAMDNPDKYVDKIVRFKGRVMKPRGMGSKFFVPGRVAMTCCADDTTFLGYVCRSDYAPHIKDCLLYTSPSPRDCS